MTDREKHDAQENEEHHHEHDRFAFYALIIFMIVLAIVAAQNFWQSQNEQTKKTDSHVPIAAASTEPLLEARTSDAFPDLHDAMFVINTSEGMNIDDPLAEKLVNDIVEAEEERVVYFTTAKTIVNTETDAAVYKMNTVSKRWQRIDKLTYSKELADHYLRVVGRQGDQLFLFYDDSNRKDMACQSFWLLGTQLPYQILTLDTTKPYEDLRPWTPRADLIESETKRLKTCEQNAK